MSDANSNGGWIPVSERMPEPQWAVLAAGQNCIRTAFFGCITGTWRSTVGTKCPLLDITVTHWMPLPEPPK